jgi:aryl-alcohol dehydrogenase-like predicted oxidoreductase
MQVRGVMAMGRLSGKYFSRKPEFRSDDNRSDWCRDEDYARFSVLAEALPEGMTMAQAAIRWILDHDGAHTICMGAKNSEDYRAAIDAVRLPSLDAGICGALEQMAERL